MQLQFGKFAQDRPQIFRLSSALSREDRIAFEQAAWAAIDALPPDAIGPGSVDRTLRPIWRAHFHPPDAEDEHLSRWMQDRPRSSGLIEREYDRPTRRERRGSQGRLRPMRFRVKTFRAGAGWLDTLNSWLDGARPQSS